MSLLTGDLLTRLGDFAAGHESARDRSTSYDRNATGRRGSVSRES
ncbi:MAG: hypothetical protein ACRDP8_00245 [Actinopolymorphaceae bacterium]